MIESLVRPELWINEVCRVNSHLGGVTEVKFGYSMLAEIVVLQYQICLGRRNRRVVRRFQNEKYPYHTRVYYGSSRFQ